MGFKDYENYNKMKILSRARAAARILLKGEQKKKNRNPIPASAIHEQETELDANHSNGQSDAGPVEFP